MSFSGKVVLLTGASAGIGAVTAVRFAKLGANLAITGRNEEALKKTTEEIKNVNSKSKVLVITADLSNPKDIQKIIDLTIKEFGRLDVLVNNAGIGKIDNIQNINLDLFDELFNINVRAVYQLTGLAVPHLLKTKGNVVNVSSLGAIHGVPEVLSYCMSKSALDQFTKCVAWDLAPKGVRVNSVNPGFVKTEFHRKAASLDTATENAIIQHEAKNHPLGRVAYPDDIAKAIIFLASDDASFTTGQILLVDGGRNLATPK